MNNNSTEKYISKILKFLHENLWGIRNSRCTFGVRVSGLEDELRKPSSNSGRFHYSLWVK